MSTKTVAVMSCDECGKSVPVDFDTKAAGPPPPPEGWFRITMTNWHPQRSIMPDVCSVDCAQKKLGALLLAPETLGLGPDTLAAVLEGEPFPETVPPADKVPDEPWPDETTGAAADLGICGVPQRESGSGYITGLTCQLPPDHGMANGHDFA